MAVIPSLLCPPPPDGSLWSQECGSQGFQDKNEGTRGRRWPPSVGHLSGQDPPRAARRGGAESKKTARETEGCLQYVQDAASEPLLRGSTERQRPHEKVLGRQMWVHSWRFRGKASPALAQLSAGEVRCPPGVEVSWPGGCCLRVESSDLWRPSGPRF